MDAFDFVERDFLVQAVVELGGAGGLVAGDARGDVEVTAVSQVLGDPVPRKVWAQISRGRPVWWARRLIILRAVTRVIGRSRGRRFRPDGQGRKRGPRRSSAIPAAAR